MAEMLKDNLILSCCFIFVLKNVILYGAERCHLILYLKKMLHNTGKGCLV